MYYYTGSIAGASVCYAFRHEDTGHYFTGWLEPAEDVWEKTCSGEGPLKNRQNDPQIIIRVPEQDIQEQYHKYGIPDSAYSEYALSVYHTSDHLLPGGICAFHAAAFLWKGKAYFFTGPSGTGKSTQLRLWSSLYGEETKIMNGDKPMIKAREDHIQVLPSPWKGKEGLGDDTLSAPLGGVICLSQGKEDRIRRVEKRAAGQMLIPRFLCRFEDKATVLSVCKLANQLLDTVPVWQLTNRGSSDSAVLVHETLIKELFENPCR